MAALLIRTNTDHPVTSCQIKVPISPSHILPFHLAKSPVAFDTALSLACAGGHLGLVHFLCIVLFSTVVCGHWLNLKPDYICLQLMLSFGIYFRLGSHWAGNSNIQKLILVNGLTRRGEASVTRLSHPFMVASRSRRVTSGPLLPDWEVSGRLS